MIPLPPTKPSTPRLATATSTLHFSTPLTLKLLRASALKKGDALAVSRIAGISASKLTSQLIPLCHNIPLSGVEVHIELIDPPGKFTPTELAAPLGAIMPFAHRGRDHAGKFLDHEKGTIERGANDHGTRDHAASDHGSLRITATARTNSQTGVEMEALVAATTAALTAYDMCKAVDRGMWMSGVRVVRKVGGASGEWVEGKRVGDGVDGAVGDVQGDGRTGDVGS